MNCQQTAEQLSAWLDGELPSAAAATMERHVASCSACTAQAEQLRSLNRQLGSLFEESRMRSQRVADRVGNQLPLHNQIVTSPLKKSIPKSFPPLAGRLGWSVSFVAAAAAGFLFALFLLPRTTQVARQPSSDASGGSPFATVEVATGPVELAPITSPVFSCPTMPMVEVGMRLRTGPGKCELSTPDGTTIRLDSDTVISVPSENELVLEQGRIWCRQSGEKPMTVQSGGAATKVDNAVCGFERSADATELIAFEGDVEVVGGQWRGRVDAGHKVRYDAEAVLAETTVGNAVIATRWVHELLVRKDENDAELQARVEQLWAAVGYAKLQNLYEDELRSLGHACVAPLTSFLKSSDKSHRQSTRRVQAAQIVADVAGFQTIPLLVELLEDDDGVVRSHAARGLHRLTGRGMAATAEQWASASAEERAKWLAAWKAWLRAQNERFPGLRDMLIPEKRILPTKA